MCGGTIRTRGKIQIDVQNFATNVPITCLWNVISQGNLLTYSIEELDIATDENGNCTINYVEVAEVLQVNSATGKNELLGFESHKKYCGTNFNKTWIVTATGHLLFSFNSTRNIGKDYHKYFKINITPIAQSKTI